LNVPPLAFLTPEELTAVRLSLTVATSAALLALPAGIGLGYLLARGRFAGKWLVEAVVSIPLVLPPVVTGYLLLVLLGTRGPIGSLLLNWFGIRLVFNMPAAVVAAMVVSFPLMVRAIRLAFQSVDPRLEMAARSLGAGRFRAFATVSLPLAHRGIVAGWTLCFARSLGEFGATMLLASNIAGQTRTIPLAIFSMTQRPGGIEASWRLVVLAILLACAAMIVSELLERSQSRHEST
jgi:molybdate transport system permease protein